MRQKYKELLLKDLSARLPYNLKGKVYAEVSDGDYDMNGDMIFYDAPFDVILDKIDLYEETIHVTAIGNEDTVEFIESQQTDGEPYTIEEFKPYLRPLSSMTEEEKKEYENLISHKEHINAQGQEWDIDCFSFNALQIIIDWLNEHHFDYRNLIEKELALQAPDNMYIKDNKIDIRKELLRGFKSLNTIDVWNGIKRQDIIDWLENQVQKSLSDVSKEITKDKDSATSFLKSAGIMNEKGELAKEYRNDTEDKPTLKFFQEGDWIVYKNEVCKITHRENGFNLITNIYGVQKEPVNERNLSTARHWTIQDAKPGDVLATDKSIFIFKQEYMAAKPEAYTGIMNNMFIANPKGCFTNENCHPATTEQKDILFQVMKTEGYEWDQEKKELKKIDQNPAWSEEDDTFFKAIIRDIENVQYISEDAKRNRINWFKSLKDRSQLQNNWKPSKEQMKALNIAIRCGIQLGSWEEDALKSLEEQLKNI